MSLATFITNAVHKVSTDEMYANVEFATREEARASFVAALLFELGLGPQPVAVHAPVQEPKEEPKEEKKAAKKRAPKKAKEEPAKTEEVKAEEVKVEEVKVEEPVKAAEPAGATKKKPGPKAKKAKEEPVVAGANAGAEPAKVEEVKVEKKKPGPKPKAKVEGPVNVEKLTPTHKKHLKAIAEELKVDSKDKEFLTYANGMSAEEWGAKPLDAHIRDFLAPEPIPLAKPPQEFVEVEFKGVTYLVDPETKFIYENVEEGAPVRNQVGTVGLLEFKDMEV